MIKEFSNRLPYSHDDVTLRLLERDDLLTTLQWRNDANVRKWFKNSNIIDVDDHYKWFESYKNKRDDYVFIILSNENSSLVGQGAIYNIDFDEKRAEIGRFIAAPDNAGKGLMKATCAAILEFAHNTMQLDTLYLEVYKNNHKAIHIYEECGFIETSSNEYFMFMECKLDAA